MASLPSENNYEDLRVELPLEDFITFFLDVFDGGKHKHRAVEGRVHFQERQIGGVFAEGSLELNGHAMDHEEAEGHEERQQGGEDVRPEMMAFQLPVPFDARFTPSGLGGV